MLPFVWSKHFWVVLEKVGASPFTFFLSLGYTKLASKVSSFLKAFIHPVYLTDRHFEVD